MQGGVDGGEHAGVVARAEVDADRVPGRAAHRLDILFQPLYVFHRHGGRLLQHVGGGGHPVGEGDDAHALLHHPGLIGHADAADAGHAGEPLLQSGYVGLKLIVVGQQHEKLGLAQSLKGLVQISPAAHPKKLLHGSPSRNVLEFPPIIKEKKRSVNPKAGGTSIKLRRRKILPPQPLASPEGM